MKREQTGIDRQSQRIYYGYIQCAPATPPHTPEPQRLLQAAMGAAHNPVPPLPREVLLPEACRGGGLPLAPPLTKWHLPLEGGGERKTVLSFDAPPIKSLRGCGAGEEEVDVLQK